MTDLPDVLKVIIFGIGAIVASIPTVLMIRGSLKVSFKKAAYICAVMYVLCGIFVLVSGFNPR